MNWTLFICVVLGAYVLGSIPFGLLIGLARGVDIRTIGSGNIGATNVARALGRKSAVLVFLLDVLKGFVPTLATRLWLAQLIAAEAASPQTVEQLATMFAATAAVVGHMCSVFLRFRGGKGAATGLGLLVAISPAAGISAFGIWTIALGLWGYVSLGSMLASSSYPLWFLLINSLSGEDMTDRWLIWGFVTALCGLVVLRHGANVSRLLAGTEPRIGMFTSRETAAGSGKTDAPE